ncbi:hypothetical protein ACWGJT_19165 [Streptomyces xantholiticus]
MLVSPVTALMVAVGFIGLMVRTPPGLPAAIPIAPCRPSPHSAG